MGCSGCTVGSNTNGTPKGCRSNGGCGSGGCNKLNTYDWLSKMDLPDTNEFHFVEVSFKNGSRKGFFHNQPHTRAVTGDLVVVETGAGSDVGKISLSGDLVRLQMKKKKIAEDAILHKVIRRANERDLERLVEARAKEKATMVRARVIARTLDLEMKVGDVEYQADKRKATFYYTADGRVDFRELIRHYAKEFRVKVEMRQIGARQESARIGGIGSCGRELCCSTWLSDFKSVSTAAARYQNLAINQTKLSGQCGRLKCCLNYELDTYMDALAGFPKNVDTLLTEAGKAVLVKTDIFKRTMYFAYQGENGFRGKFYPLSLERVKEISQMNKNGKKPSELQDKVSFMDMGAEAVVDSDFGGDVDGVVELPPEERRRRKKRNNKKRSGGNQKPREQSRNKNKQQNKSSRGQQKGSGSKSGQGQQNKKQSNKPAGQKGQQQKNQNEKNQSRKASSNNKNNPAKKGDQPNANKNTGGKGKNRRWNKRNNKNKK